MITWIIQKYDYVNDNNFIFWYLWGDEVGFWYTRYWRIIKKGRLQDEIQKTWIIDPNHKYIDFVSIFPSARGVCLGTEIDI